MTIYLSGPMSLYKDTDYNYAEFNRVTAILRKAGHTVINPAEIPGQPGWTWKDYLIRDIILILTCRIDAVVLLPDWKKSSGALAEIFNTIKVLESKAYEYLESASGEFILRQLLFNWDHRVFDGGVLCQPK